MNSFQYYYAAKAQGLNPLLLDFVHPEKKTPLSICGIAPSQILEVRNDRLYKNGIEEGHALKIFEYLETISLSKNFFPAYLGFFSYEFSSYFGLPVHGGERLFPDAFFALYEKGLVIDDGKIIFHDKIRPEENLSKKLPIQRLSPLLEKEEFIAKVEAIKDKIRAGHVYQVNFSLPFYFSQNSPIDALYQAMKELNPSPFMGLLEHDDWAIISGSPERLFAFSDERLSTRPIAGTKKRGENSSEDTAIVAELLACPKENAEHVMLVDLLRNDVHQVAESESVRVVEDRSVEFYSHVIHLVSEISGVCKESLREVKRALFPGGTITGAPKKSVMNAIASLESAPRGPYTGSLGYVSGIGTDFNILIRSVLKNKERMWINSGAGIVINSEPESEWREVHRKAGFIKDILEHGLRPKAPRKHEPGPARNSFAPLKKSENANIIFIENEDSFSFNIIALLKNLGSHINIVRLTSSINWKKYSHVVIGPGPGNPAELHDLRALIGEVIKSQRPLLGICLGHQAIGHYFGAKIIARPPVHGQSMPISHSGKRLFKDLEQPFMATRYHSLAIEQAPKDFIIDAHVDDCIMAISHAHLPIFGVQFHPESYLSKKGHLIFDNFLQVK